MKYCLFFFTLLLPLIAQNEPELNLSQPKDVLVVLEKTFANFETYQAEFREYSLGLLRRGKIQFKKPHYLKVTYFDRLRRPKMEIYSNGKTLYLYVKTLNIVCQQDLQHGEVSDQQGLAEKIQLEQLLRNYNFNFLEAKEPVDVVQAKEYAHFNLNLRYDAKAYHFDASPKDKTLGLNPMEIWISKRGEIMRCKASTVEGRKIDFLFSQIETGVSLADQLFEFEAPNNVQVLKNTLIDFDSLEDKTPEEGLSE